MIFEAPSSSCYIKFCLPRQHDLQHQQNPLSRSGQLKNSSRAIFAKNLHILASHASFAHFTYVRLQKPFKCSYKRAKKQHATRQRGTACHLHNIGEISYKGRPYGSNSITWQASHQDKSAAKAWKPYPELAVKTTKYRDLTPTNIGKSLPQGFDYIDVVLWSLS